MTTKTKSKKSQEKILPTEMDPHETVIKFEESFKWPGTGYRVTFDGPAFQNWVHETLPMTRSMKPMDYKTAAKKGTRIGEFTFYLRPMPLWRWGSRWEQLGIPSFLAPEDSKIPVRCGLELFRQLQTAKCSFSTVVNIPVLAKHDPYKRDWLNPWMSLTPNEVITQRGQIRRAKGNVAMAGMGLGWSARRVLERKQVKHLTVYDKSEEVLDYFGKPLQHEFGDRLTLVCANAYEVDWLQYDVALWDIWEDWGGAAWDDKYLDIRRRMRAEDKVCVGWGEGVPIP